MHHSLTFQMITVAVSAHDQLKQNTAKFGCAGYVMDSGLQRELGLPSSNSSRLRYIRLHAKRYEFLPSSYL